MRTNLRTPWQSFCKWFEQFTQGGRRGNFIRIILVEYFVAEEDALLWQGQNLEDNFFNLNKCTYGNYL